MGNIKHEKETRKRSMVYLFAWVTENFEKTGSKDIEKYIKFARLKAKLMLNNKCVVSCSYRRKKFFLKKENLLSSLQLEAVKYILEHENFRRSLIRSHLNKNVCAAYKQKQG